MLILLFTFRFTAAPDLESYQGRGCNEVSVPSFPNHGELFAQTAAKVYRSLLANDHLAETNTRNAGACIMY